MKTFLAFTHAAHSAAFHFSKFPELILDTKTEGGGTILADYVHLAQHKQKLGHSDLLQNTNQQQCLLEKEQKLTQ